MYYKEYVKNTLEKINDNNLIKKILKVIEIIKKNL